MKNMYHVFFALLAASAAFAKTVDLIDLTGDYIAQDGDTLTGTLYGEDQPYKITIADGATVTLDNAEINGVDNSDYKWAGITCLGNCTIVLEGLNTVNGFYKNYPGIQAAKNEGDGEEYTLTIEGKGKGGLDASSNGYGAGIGGGYQGKSGNITISDCFITATGGQSAAGIGGGYQGKSGNITISGGLIIATGGNRAAGIGSGEDGSIGDITISGGEVAATGGNSAAGIGSGYYGSSGNITITNGVTSVVATKGEDASYSIYTGPGKATIGGAEPVNYIAESPFVYVPRRINLAKLTADYVAQDGDTLTGTLGGNYMISIANDAKVTLKNVIINGVNDKVCNNGSDDDYCRWAGITCLGNCTIVLKGSNTVKGFYEDYPGIQAAKNEGEGGEYTLTIEGNGSLDASSNGYGAGIGGGPSLPEYAINCGNITIAGGTIAATGGDDAAGIGAGKSGTSGAITISGGKVTATGGGMAAGIGSGNQGTSGAIIISGGEVTAKGGGFAAGIGSGTQGTSGAIIISGGEVTATGGDFAAGIGSGSGGKSGDITITNDVTKVVATKGEDATYSVGKGFGDAGVGTITIGGEVVDPIARSPFKFPYIIDLAKLTENYEAEDGDVLTGTLDVENHPVMISIANDAKVTLKNATINGTNDWSCRGDEPCFWAGLTCLGNCTIVLEGSNTVKGFHSPYPGIQAAKNGGEGEEYTLTIEGYGTLDARSNGSGAGIGCGDDVNCGNITISSGKITATGGSQAAGIGGASDGTCGNITISGGEVTATGGMFAAGIGSGGYTTCGNITISGGIITATGGYGDDEYGGAGAGIGSSVGGTSGAITISGGEVTATGGYGAAGIGGGKNGTSGDITITNDVTKVVALRGSNAAYSIGEATAESVGTITIGGTVMETSVAKELFVFPSTLVDIVDIGGKTYAIVDGDYSGEGALNIATDKNVDKVIFERTFPVVDGDNNYSTIMFPFAISADKVGNVKQAFKFLGIGVDKENRKVVTVEPVTNFEAYKPYLIQLESEKTSISIDNTEPLVFKANPTADGAYDVEQSEGYNQYGDYVFHGVVQTKTWSTGDPDLAEGGAAYGFASTAGTDVSVGQFVKVGVGAFIKPLRGYIYKKQPKKVKANGAYVLRQTASVDDDLPDVMNVVVVDRKKDGGEQTTVIGQFNSRTGEFRLNRTKRTYDLKGRSVRDASRKAKSVYLKK